MIRSGLSILVNVLSRLFVILFGGLLLAGIVHIVLVLILPSRATEDAWSEIQRAELAQNRFSATSGIQSSFFMQVTDPQFGVAVCPFNLNNGPISVSSNGDVPLWTFAIFNTKTQNTYSINDRLAASKQLDLVVVNPGQLAELQEIGAQELEKRIVVPLDFNEGFLLLRAFQRNAIASTTVQSFLESASCDFFEPDLDSAIPPRDEPLEDPDDNSV